MRADAQRNIDALLEAAMAVFAASGVDAPVREIAEKAGVGVGTVYRHFPQRSDLIAAVFRREVDACADAAPVLAAEHEPGRGAGPMDAAVRRLHRRQTRAGRGPALGRPGLSTPYRPTSRSGSAPRSRALLDAAAAAGKVAGRVEPYDLLRAVASLCTPGHDVGPDHARRMVDLLIDGLRFGASAPVIRPSLRSGIPPDEGALARFIHLHHPRRPGTSSAARTAPASASARPWPGSSAG